MFNRYVYAANDPVNLIDPDGQKVTGGENCESQPDTEVLVCDKVTVTPDDWDFNSRSGPGRPVVSSTLRPSRIEPPTPNTFHWNDPCSGSFAFAKTAIGKGGDMTKLQTFGLGAFFGGGVGISHTNFYDPKTGIYGYSDAFSWGPGLGGGAGVTLGTTNARAYEMGGNSVSINMGVSDASVGGSLSKAEDGRPLVSGSAGFESGVPGPFDNIRAGFSGTSDHATRTLCGAYK